MRLLTMIWLLPRNTAIAVMKLYRKCISPLYGDVCRYWPTCSRYALETFQHRGFLEGMWRTVWRLVRCNPWSAGGIDDPAPFRNRQLVLNPYGFVVWQGSKPDMNTYDEGQHP